MKLKLLAAVCILFFFTNCKKDGKGCWQAFSPFGAAVQGLTVCDKTKTEAEAAYPQYWFYKAGEKKYCWKVQIAGNTAYTGGITESMAQRYREENGAYQLTKIDCNSFCTVEWNEKHKGKLTNQFGPTRRFIETILSADSCNRLSVGRVVVMRETGDSLITRELVKKNP